MMIYFNINNPDLPLSIESIGNRLLQPSMTRKNGYPYYHWIQTESGLGEVLINNTRIELPPGKGIFIPPFQPHQYHAKYNPEWYTSFVTFTGTLSEDFSKIIGTSEWLLAGETQQFSFQNWIDLLVKEHGEMKTLEMDASLSCYEFLLNIRRFKEENSDSQHRLYQTYVADALAYIETNYQDSITVEQIADHCFISPQYLSRLFNRFTGVSTSTYIRNFRIKKGKEALIHHPSAEVQLVAHWVGFKDSSHFVSTFKKETNYTPLEFRHLYG